MNRWLAGAGAALMSVTVAWSQQCFDVSNLLHDVCGASQRSTIEWNMAMRAYAMEGRSGHPYGVLVLTNGATVYDLSSPLAPTKVGSVELPWDWFNPFGDYYDSHGQYVDHIRDVAALDGFPYAVVPLLNYGWDVLRLWDTPGYLEVGYEPAEPLALGKGYQSAALYRAGSNIYVVGQALDAASIAAGNSSIKIYLLSSGGAAPTVTYQTIPVVGTLANSAGFSAPQSYTVFDTFVTPGGKTWLLANNIYDPGAAMLTDITDPAHQGTAKTLTDSDLPDAFRGRWAVDRANARLYVGRVASSPARVVLDAYDLSNPPATPLLFSTTVIDNLTTTVGKPFVAASGDLVVVGFGKAYAYVSVAGGAPSVLPAPSPTSSAYRAVRLRDDDCTYSGFGEIPYAPGVIQVSGGYAALRPLSVDADVVKVASGCLSTEPHASFTVSNTDGDEATAASCGSADADGFPSDTFRIADTSSGDLTGLTGSWTITGPSGYSYTKTWSAGLIWNWNSPSDRSGDFTATLTLDGTYTATQSIRLCNNPQATLAIQESSYLKDDTIHLQASQTGVPAASPYSFVIQPPSGSVINSTSNPTPLTLSQSGNYKAGVAVAYGFPAATDDSDCSNTLFSSLGLGSNGHYDSCAVIDPIHSGYGGGSFVVKQNGQLVASPASPGSVLVGQQVDLYFTGEIASGYNAYFLWTIGSTGVTPSCDYGGAPANYTNFHCSIPANTLPASGSAQSWSLEVHICNSGTPGQDCTSRADTLDAGTAQVTPTAATFTFSLNDTNFPAGQEVYIQLTSVSGTFNSLTFDLGGALTCDGDPDVVYNCNPLPGIIPYQCTAGRTIGPIRFGTETTTHQYTVTGRGSVVGDGTVSAANSVNVTVSAGSCSTTSCTYSISPTSKTFSASGGTGSVSVSTSSGCAWTASESASWITITSGSSGSGSGTVSYSVTANGSSSTRQATMSIAGKSFTVTQSGSGGGGTLSITPSPATAEVGQEVTFTFSPAVAMSGDSVSFTFGDGGSGRVDYNSLCGLFGGCTSIKHTYNSTGTFTVGASGTASGTGVSGSTSVTVQDTSCTEPNKPTAAFTFSPSKPVAGQPVQFTDTSSGHPTSWKWGFGDGIPPLIAGGSSTQQSPAYTFDAEGSYTVTLTATNCKGSSTTSYPVVVAAECTATTPPTADFSFSALNQAEVASAYPDQQQPYAGQAVQFTDNSSDTPDGWSWTFGDGGTSTAADPTHTFASAGAWNVVLKAHNCVGWSGEAPKTVTVYEDHRPVTASFSIDGGGSASSGDGAQGSSTNAFSTGTELTFTARTGFEYGDPTHFEWTFGDGTPAVEGNPASHSYACRGNYTVTLKAARHTMPGNASSPMVEGTSTATIFVDGEVCAPEAVITTGAANLPGLYGSDWHTDMFIFNPADTSSQVWLAALPAGQSTPQPETVNAGTLAPKGTLFLPNVLQEYFPEYTKASIQVTYANDEDLPPVVVSRTYTNAAGGGTCGQFVPGQPVLMDATQSPLWLTGLRQTGDSTGFRTNVGLTNLLGGSNSVSPIQLTLFDTDGAMRASKTVGLAPHMYLQWSLEGLFGPDVAAIGPCSLKVDLPSGAQVQAYFSEVDNRTNDPFFSSGRPEGAGTITLVGVAHNAGELGTVWRTDAQFTNTDDQTHTWELKFHPQNDPSLGTFRRLTIEPHQSFFAEDLVQWLFEGVPGGTPETNGLVCVAALDDSGVMPAVSVRTYNLAPTGSYGQFVPPLQAADGAEKDGLNTRLFLTGMSSQDIARTNIGFVNLDDAAPVELAVYFYDAQGDTLNPGGEPYTLALEPNGWYQTRLEDLFDKAFHIELGVNLPAISAEIVVRNGGPGFAYASTVDPVTGDAIFIPGRLGP